MRASRIGRAVASAGSPEVARVTLSPFSTRQEEVAGRAVTSDASEPDIDVVVDLADLDDDELELSDDDFVLLEAGPASPRPSGQRVAQPLPRPTLMAGPPPSAPASVRPIAQARLDTLRTKTLRAGLRLDEPKPLPLPLPLPPPPAELERVRESRRSFSRLTLDEDAEASVADECLATIAAATSHARLSDPMLVVAAADAGSSRQRDEVDALLDGAGTSPLALLPPASVPPRSSSSVTIPPPSSSAAIVHSPRLPPVRPPPFGRGSVPPARSSIPGVAPMVSDDNDAAETLPFPMRTPFARVATDDDRPSRDLEWLPSVSSPPAASDVRSVVPVAVPRNDATNVTVIVRERPPRMAWVVAAGAIGALAAVLVMRVFAPASPVTATVAPPPATAAPSAAPPAVVRFGEEDGVAIKVPAPSPPASHAVHPVTAPASASASPRHAHPAASPSPSPARPSRALSPKVAAPVQLPDGSLGLASTGKAASSASAPAPAPTPLPLPPSGGRKRPLTPEQELAEAQLRAAAAR